MNECVPGYIVLFLYTLPLKYMFVFDIVFEFHLYSVPIMLPLISVSQMRKIKKFWNVYNFSFSIYKNNINGKLSISGMIYQKAVKKLYTSLAKRSPTVFLYLMNDSKSTNVNQLSEWKLKDCYRVRLNAVICCFYIRCFTFCLTFYHIIDFGYYPS